MIRHHIRFESNRSSSRVVGIAAVIVAAISIAGTSVATIINRSIIVGSFCFNIMVLAMLQFNTGNYIIIFIFFVIIVIGIDGIFFFFVILLL